MAMTSLCKCIRCFGRSHGKLCGALREAGTRRYSGSDTAKTTCESLYDMRKFSKELPTSSWALQFEGLMDFPTGVFRCTDGEILGPCAGKCSFYRNPEYFSFHDMSFFDFSLCLSKYRQPPPVTGRKP